MRILLATRNENKAREIRHIIGKTIEIASLNDIGVEPHPEEDTIENEDTFLQNAIAKATYFAKKTRLTTLADDSGLIVHTLGNKPGVKSKRFAGRDDLTGPELDEANNLYLLQALKETPNDKRTAHFVCTAAVATPERTLTTTIGTVAGTITDTPTGHHGFGYDPLFLIPELGVTLGALTPEKKNEHSHRARAFQALIGTLEYIKQRS